jgi:hypothetical protein
VKPSQTKTLVYGCIPDDFCTIFRAQMRVDDLREGSLILHNRSKSVPASATQMEVPNRRRSIRIIFIVFE